MTVKGVVARVKLRKLLRVAVLFGLAAAVLLLVNSAEELAGGTLNARRLYRYAITSGFRDASVDNTAVILVKSDKEPRQVTFSNVCQQRAFIARLFDVILAKTDEPKPAVVVIDKFSAPDSCRSPEELANTDKLLTAVEHLAGAGIRVIVGQTTSGSVTDTGEEILEPIVYPASARVTPASIVFEEDPRRVVFSWPVAREDGTKVSIDTLSFAAARAYRPELLQRRPRLRAFHDANDAPFVKFLTLDDFAPFRFSAIELLCGKGSGPATSWQDCNSPDRDALAKLANRVVFIGEDSFGMDQHDTVVGPMPGVFVHANYVEAFLHDDLYKAAPWMLDILLALLVCVLVEVIAARVKPLGWRIASIAVFLVLAYGMCIFAVRESGYFIDPAFGLVAAVAGQAADGIRHFLRNVLDRGAPQNAGVTP